MIGDPDDTTDFHIASHVVRVHQKREEAVAPTFMTAQLKHYIAVGKSKKPKDDSSLNSFRSSGGGKSVPGALEKNWDGSQKTNDILLLSYSEWEKGGLDGEDVQITMTSETKVSQIISTSKSN
nr:DNA replication licensing factor MCM6 [Tanacetum cinerariifolium]